MAVHPHHDAVSREVRSWYTASTPEIGIVVRREAYGYLTDSDRADRRRLILTVDTAEEVGAALDAASAHYRDARYDVWVDDRTRAGRVHGSLAAAGLEVVQETVALALVGPIRADPGPAGLSVEEVVDPAGLQEWATVKLQGFGDTEDRPTASEVESEAANRRAEWPVCRYVLGRVDGEAVAILGHYTGSDQMVFLLATRKPYRHQGIGQTLLAGMSARAESEGARSVLINCDDGGPAHALYRRIGFTDEVYWYRRYTTSA